MNDKVWRWVLGLIYIFAVAAIWIAASFVVQSVVDTGVSPFLITYICNSLFVVYVPIVEVGHFLEDSFGSYCFWRKRESSCSSIPSQILGESERVVLLGDKNLGAEANDSFIPVIVEEESVNKYGGDGASGSNSVICELVTPLSDQVKDNEYVDQVDAKGRWTRTRVAKVSLLICPFWFLAQYTFNLSLKYTTVTVSIIRFLFEV